MSTEEAIKREAVIRILKEMDAASISIHDLLDAKKQIGIIWGVDDIDAIISDKKYTFRPKLTENEKFAVLKEAERHNDATMGITWDTLEWYLEDMYEDRIKK